MDELNKEHLIDCYRMWYSLADASNLHQGVGWTKREIQEQRFARASEMFKGEELTPHILDIGCGIGHYPLWLQRNGYLTTHYTGIDLVPEFVQRCREQGFKAFEKDAKSINRDYDYSVAIGTFHYLIYDCTDPLPIIEQRLKRIYKHTRKEFFFTLLRTALDEYHTFSPIDVKELLQNYNNVDIKEDGKEYFIKIQKGGHMSNKVV